MLYAGTPWQFTGISCPLPVSRLPSEEQRNTGCSLIMSLDIRTQIYIDCKVCAGTSTSTRQPSTPHGRVLVSRERRGAGPEPRAAIQRHTAKRARLGAPHGVWGEPIVNSTLAETRTETRNRPFSACIDVLASWYCARQITGVG